MSATFSRALAAETRSVFLAGPTRGPPNFPKNPAFVRCQFGGDEGDEPSPDSVVPEWRLLGIAEGERREVRRLLVGPALGGCLPIKPTSMSLSRSCIRHMRVAAGIRSGLHFRSSPALRNAMGGAGFRAPGFGCRHCCRVGSAGLGCCRHGLLRDDRLTGRIKDRIE